MQHKIRHSWVKYSYFKHACCKCGCIKHIRDNFKSEYEYDGIVTNHAPECTERYSQKKSVDAVQMILEICELPF